MAAVPRDVRDCKQQQKGKPWRPHNRLVLQGGEHWQNIYGDENVAQCHSARRVRDASMGNGYGTAAGCLRPPRLSRGGWNFPRVVSKVWQSHPPLRLGLCCRHKSTWHLRAGCRERIYGNWRRHMAGPTWIQMASLKWRPGLHPWHCLLFQTHRKDYLGCSFFRMERRLWHTANNINNFSSPFTRLKEPQVQTWLFTPQSQAVEMESVHAVSEGWGDVQLQHERHLVYQCYLQKHRSTPWLTGSTARAMLLAMLPCQVLQQSGSADTAGAYCCLLISGCMQ